LFAVRFNFGAEFGELVFVVGPAVDSVGGFLVEEEDLGLQVGDLSLGFEQGGLGFLEGWKGNVEAAMGAAVGSGWGEGEAGGGEGCHGAHH